MPKPEPSTESIYISRKHAALLLAVSDQTIDALIRAKQLAAFRVGRAVRIKKADLLKWVERHQL